MVLENLQSSMKSSVEKSRMYAGKFSDTTIFNIKYMDIITNSQLIEN
jgi:hypothetical protein